MISRTARCGIVITMSSSSCRTRAALPCLMNAIRFGTFAASEIASARYSGFISASFPLMDSGMRQYDQTGRSVAAAAFSYSAVLPHPPEMHPHDDNGGHRQNEAMEHV